MKAIILAAGGGKRIKHFTNMPKCLLKINSQTILDYQIQSLLRCGVKSIFIVTGYRGDLVADYVKKLKGIQIVHNSRFNSTDNAYSLTLALQKVRKGPVLILDGDIVFHPLLLKRLASSRWPSVIMADCDQKINPEDSKVRIQHGFATGIGKGISGQGIYASLCKLSRVFLLDFLKELKKPKYFKTWYSKPLNEILRQNPKKVKVLTTNGYPRMDVDTQEELLAAKKMVRKFNAKI